MDLWLQNSLRISCKCLPHWERPWQIRTMTPSCNKQCSTPPLAPVVEHHPVRVWQSVHRLPETWMNGTRQSWHTHCHQTTLSHRLDSWAAASCWLPPAVSLYSFTSGRGATSTIMILYALTMKWCKIDRWSDRTFLRIFLCVILVLTLYIDWDPACSSIRSFEKFFLRLGRLL